MRVGHLAAALAVLAGLSACGDDADPVEPASTSPSEPDRAAESHGDPERAPAAAASAVDPGTAVVEAGGERFEFVLDECAVGEEQTGSPYARVRLTGNLADSGGGADGFLNVSILVSRVLPGHEEHVITITRLEAPSLGAADVNVPSRGGPAPDDWIEVGDGVVTGAGFELREIEPGGRTYPGGTLVADCTAASSG